MNSEPKFFRGMAMVVIITTAKITVRYLNRTVRCKKGEEQRRSNLFCCLCYNLPVVFLFFSLFIMLNMLMCILYHNDSSINHCTNGDGNTTEGHDIGIYPLILHNNERDKNCHWKGEYGNKSRTEV